jgi:eukaryotic-like serine/threonine-protein kinase
VVGETIGSYRILSQLGAGAMGQVYLAEHRRLRRKVALKLLARELVDQPELLERFFLEARATSAIEHPGIVQIFDCDVDPTGRPYIVMEYLEGETLAAVLTRRGPLPALTCARLARGVAEALEAAHAKGIVHRDIKPENMFVRSEPPDSIKLVDFGIAKLAGDFQAGQVHRTRAGALMGTPVYMSPEQCRDSASIDARTDIYSLGCVTFEMLTGRPPFNRDNLGDLVVAHLTEQPRDVREINASVPAALAELTRDLLRKDPAERPATMRAVADRLGAVVASLTTLGGGGGGAIGVVAGPPVVASAATVAAVSGSAPPSKTTFGGAASEVVSDGDGASALRRQRRGPLVAGLVAAAILVGGGVLVLPRLRSHMVDPVAAATDLAPSLASAAGRPATVAAPTIAPGPPGAMPVVKESRPPPSAPTPPTLKPLPAHAKIGITRHLGESAAPAERSPRSAPSPSPSSSAPSAAPSESPADLSGRWEGPWTDPGNQQKGRLFLELSGDGSVNGWMYNTAAKQSFRMAGRFAPRGELSLGCQCAPSQAFTAAGALHPTGGELKGVLTLTSAAGAFGQSHVVLRRTTAAH